jgi:2-polyprenyl-6-methoxyphenol hydroxylase-like FAD-dependent oxidoreductase
MLMAPRWGFRTFCSIGYQGLTPLATLLGPYGAASTGKCFSGVSVGVRCIERSEMSDTQVLIVGAGPTGLVLAYWLTRRNVRVRIIDKLAEPGTTSRALVVHARTLEFYRQLGLADDVVKRGREFTAANLWVRGREVGRVGFGAMGQGLSPFPYMLVYAQDEHERMLIEKLRQLGVEVERGTEFVGCEVRGESVAARLRTANGAEETCTADYVAGCDGAHSAVRHAIGASFPGGTYAHMFYVADVMAAGPVMNGELHVALDEADFLAVFPLHENGQARLIGIVREDLLGKGDQLAWQDVSTTVIERLGIKVSHVNWFSTYHVHHRVADRFYAGRIFLLGDAAHIHSPVGGQGMNTGIGDAVNLAWKLAAVVANTASPQRLDSYQPERIAFARRLVATTDRAFTFVTSTGRIARFVRVQVVPRLLPLLFRSVTIRRFMFRTVSQIAINYRNSPISKGRSGKLHAGDRLPWVPPDEPIAAPTSNFDPLKSLDWQVHTYGKCEPAVAEFCKARGLPLHEFPWSPAAERASLYDGAAYLIRPDGYIGLTSTEAQPATLENYMQSLGATGYASAAT